MMIDPLVYIIILNWNGFELTKKCLNSLLSVTYSNYKILVVDNGSNDGSVERISDEFPDINVLSLPKNIGFASGNNVGFKYISSENPDYMIFLNNDTTVDKNFIRPLVNQFEKGNNTGITVPKIFYSNEKELLWYGGGVVDFWKGRIYHEGIREVESSKYSKVKTTGYATGCCFCIKPYEYNRLNGFDETFPMYGEDVDLSLRIRKTGKNIYFVPDSIIWHEVSASLGGAFSLRKLKKKAKGIFKVFAKHATILQFITIILFLPFNLIHDYWKYFVTIFLSSSNDIERK